MMMTSRSSVAVVYGITLKQTGLCMQYAVRRVVDWHPCRRGSYRSSDWVPARGSRNLTQQLSGIFGTEDSQGANKDVTTGVAY